MTPDDANHLAHYLLDEKDESEWGKMRANDGLEEPVEVYYWELGNEIDGMANIITDGRVKTYTDWAIGIVEAIKKDFPDEKFLYCGRSAAWGVMPRDPDDPLSPLQWGNRILPILAPYIDGMGFHPYYDGFSSEYMMYLADMFKKQMDDFVEELQLKDKDGNPKEMVVLLTNYPFHL